MATRFIASILEFFGNIVTVIGVVLAVPLAIVWFAGGIVGAIYWIVEDHALNAVLSTFIPLYGAVTVIIDLAGG